MLIPVLLSGGVGSRLWPLSRENYPKQFLPLLGEKSLFQQTLERLVGLPEIEQTMVIAQQAHRFLIAEQLRTMSFETATTLLLEPAGKNTAPAAALAAFTACKSGAEDALLLVLPADHCIHNVTAFQQNVREAAYLAEMNKLVTFGIKPTRAEIGYGYISVGAAIEGTQGYIVEGFIEKPDIVKAHSLIEKGSNWWNSGMFIFKASAYLSNLKQFAPQIYQACEQAIQKAAVMPDYTYPDESSFLRCPSDSIDYAIMEHSPDVAVVPLDSDWCDVGSWSVLSEQFEADVSNNVCQGTVYLEDCKNTYVRSESRLVAGVGLENMVVVETPDALLVMNKEQDQQIKPLIKKMKAANLPELAFHRKVHRPWGAFEGLDKGPRYQVKRITVAPGGKLSLQMHHHRSEHWVVVKGSAQVQRGEDSFLLTENQSTYIPIGVVHRLENVGKIELEIIEVQSGSYLGEDDIVRLEDTYGREKEKAGEPVD
jgi:mannose-1-phosphate guanylyltransferase/mannose-6-phosphate isomerase